jgi:hypothetical protein
MERIGEFKFIKEGVIEFLKSDEVESLLLEIGDEIARDAGTVNPNGEYSTDVLRTRKWRSVIIVKDTSKGAIGREAARGYLARVARKKRT